MNEIICDRCGTVLLPEIKTKMIRDLEFTYFVCPKCKLVYTVSVTDSALRKEIENYSRIRKIMQKNVVFLKFLKVVEKIKMKNIKRGEELKAKYHITYEDVK